LRKAGELAIEEVMERRVPMKFEKTRKSVATLGLLAALILGFAAPAFAASFTNVTLGP
jgi:hypothetical protein